MPSSVVLINCEVGSEISVLDSVCALEETEKAYLVYGVYDVVAVLTTATMDGLEALLIKNVRSLPGIRSTLTLMISKDCTKK